MLTSHPIVDPFIPYPSYNPCWAGDMPPLSAQYNMPIVHAAGQVGHAFAPYVQPTIPFAGPSFALNVEPTLPSVGPSYLTPIEEHGDDINEDSDDEVDKSMQENSIQCAIEDNEADHWVHQAYANNEYIEFEDTHPDEVIDEEMVRNFAVEPISFEENTNLSEDQGFAVGQVFTSKEQLVNAVTEWSLKRSVGFKTEKCKLTKYTIVCANNSKSTTEKCPWRLVAAVKKRFMSAWRTCHVLMVGQTEYTYRSN